MKTKLSTFLNELRDRYHRPEFLSSDPLEFVHRYANPLDQEAVALIAALLAYGNVKQIRRSVADLLARMAPRSPSEFVRSLSAPEGRKQGQRAFRGFIHRFNQGEDMVLLLELLNRSWHRYGSLGAHFCQYLDEDAEDISLALSKLITDWRAWAGSRAKTGYFSYLLNSPLDGSCCKRWCMFLRWMGRHDAMDPGLWTRTGALARTIPTGRYLRSEQLVIPLDTHTGRISQYLGLTKRKTLGWEAALEVTKNLKICDPADPTQYDFALSRLGILSLCKKKYRPEVCSACDLLTVCKFARARSRAEVVSL